MSGSIRLGILISGGGTTFLNLHQKINSGHLPATIKCVVSSSSKALGLKRARELGYPSQVVRRSRFQDDATFSQAITEIMQAHDVELIVMGGFLKKYLPSKPYLERCINIHPSLIPAFSGQGYYGMNVHRAVWERSCKITGCTVHLVNANYDEGPIILQKATQLSHRDTPDTIKDKVFGLECEALPQAITYFVKDRIRFENGRSIIDEND